MTDKTGEQAGCRQTGSGPSSFWMQDPGLVFDQLALKPGMQVLDLGCGRGDYSLEAAARVNPGGLVTALDVSATSVADLRQAAANLGMENLRVDTADIIRALPIEEGWANLCFLSTVLHIPHISSQLGGLLEEVARVLAPGGRFIVLECKKEEWDFGPPIDMKWSPDQVQEAVTPYGFQKISLSEFEYNYCIQFIHQK